MSSMPWDSSLPLGRAGTSPNVKECFVDVLELGFADGEDALVSEESARRPRTVAQVRKVADLPYALRRPSSPEVFDKATIRVYVDEVNYRASKILSNYFKEAYKQPKEYLADEVKKRFSGSPGSDDDDRGRRSQESSDPRASATRQSEARSRGRRRSRPKSPNGLNYKYGSGVKMLLAQARKPSPDQWFLLTSWDFSNPDSVAARGLPFIPELKSGETSLIRYFLQLIQLFHQPDRNWAHVMRRIGLRQGHDGQLAVFISCRTVTAINVLRKGQENPTYKFLPSVTEHFVQEFLRLDQVYQPLRRRDNCEYVILLHYLHANLNLFTEYLENLTNGYVKRRRQDFDPRSSKLRRWVLEEIASDAHHYRNLSAAVDSLSGSIDALIGILKAYPENQGVRTESWAQFAMLETELKSYCKDLDQRLIRLTNDLDTSLKYLDTIRNRDQTEAVRLLTILATIFLPLSLSTGVLSMQSRFKDLGVLLYDFFGVVFLSAAVVIVILGVIILASLIKEQTTRVVHEWTFRRVWAKWSFLMGLTTFLVGCLILSSFLVGMFKDVHLGSKILGYGLAIFPGSPLLIIFLYYAGKVVYQLLICLPPSMFALYGVGWMISKRRKDSAKKQDLEGNNAGLQVPVHAEDLFANYIASSRRNSVRQATAERKGSSKSRTAQTMTMNEHGAKVESRPRSKESRSQYVKDERSVQEDDS